MTETYAYPPEVAATLRQQWPAHGVPLPPLAVLTGFVAGGFQASLLREEDRPVQCHLFLLPGPRPAEGLDQTPLPPPEVTAAFQVLAFSEPRTYSAQELRRLSPTTQRVGTLLAVAAAPTGELTIEGLVFATRPWDSADTPHQTGLLPPTLFMQVAGPGRLAFFCGAQPVLVLQQGQVGDYGGHEFPTGWLSGFAQPEANPAGLGPDDAGVSFTRQLGSYCLRLCLARVRALGHGGMLVLVPGPDAPRLVGPAGLLRPKYGVRDNDLGTRYRALLARLLARSTALGLADWLAYRLTTDGELLQLRTELEQFADLLADLMAVDGALALDKQFNVLGFGVEIAAPAPPTPFVYRALDAEGTQRQAEAADSGGTRHRAAYRLCQAEAGCQAIVVSQDGGIRLVRQQAGQVVFWNQLLL
ncbi:MAG: putative sensor domain DACNV-containing protein [Janthinobacterium lividum]